MFKKRDGFTIIEALTTIVIIGVLATIAAVSYVTIERQARTSGIMVDLRQSATLINLFQLDNDDLFPVSLSQVDDMTISTDNTQLVMYSVDQTGDEDDFCLTIERGDIAYHVTKEQIPREDQCAAHMPLSAPNINIGLVAPEEIEIQWSAVSLATHYNIEYSTNSDFSNIQTISDVFGTSLAVTGLEESTTYYFRAYAVNQHRTSQVSNAINATTTINVLGAPVITATSNSSSQITVSWAAVGMATQYRLQYATNNTFTEGLQNVTGITDISRSVTGLSAGTQYYFRVYAINANGEGDASNTTTATTRSDAPTVVATTNSTTQITASWGSVSGATQYRLQYATNNGFTTGLQTISGIVGTSQPVIGLSPGTTYYFRAYAVNAGGDSAVSNTASTITRAIAPTISAVADSASQATVSWATVPGASSYRLQYATNSGFTTGLQVISDIATTNRVVTGLSTGTTYYFRAYAVNAGGDSVASNTVNVQTDYIPPSAPSASTVALSASGTSLTGTATAVSCVSPAAIQYRLNYRTNAGSWSSTSWSSTRTHTLTMSQGNDYQFYAQTRCYNSTSELYSTEVSGAETTRHLYMVAPSGSAVSLSASGATLTATAATVSCGGATTQYALYYRTNAGSWVSARSWSTTRTHTLTMSQGNGYNYYAQTRCYKGAPHETYSSATTGATSSAHVYLNAPSGPGSSHSTSGATITGTAASVSCGTATTQYALNYYRSGTSQGYNSWSTSRTRAVTMSQGYSYRFQSKARCYNSAYGVYSSESVGSTGPTYTYSVSSPSAPSFSVTPSADNGTSAYSLTIGTVTCGSGLTAQYRLASKARPHGGSWPSSWSYTAWGSTRTFTKARAMSHQLYGQARCINSTTGNASTAVSSATITRNCDTSKGPCAT